jgi:hypothetical protein
MDGAYILLSFEHFDYNSFREHFDEKNKNKKFFLTIPEIPP